MTIEELRVGDSVLIGRLIGGDDIDCGIVAAVAGDRVEVSLDQGIIVEVDRSEVDRLAESMSAADRFAAVEAARAAHERAAYRVHMVLDPSSGDLDDEVYGEYETLAEAEAEAGGAGTWGGGIVRVEDGAVDVGGGFAATLAEAWALVPEAGQ